MFHIFFGTTKSFLYVFNIYITYINKSNKTLLLIFRPLIFPPLHQNIRIASPFGRRGSMVRQLQPSVHLDSEKEVVVAGRSTSDPKKGRCGVYGGL